MNEKTTKQIEEMMNQTIGVEVEMNSITRTKAAELAAEFFGTGRHEHTAGRNGYDTYSAWDGEGREWKFQKDVSIAGPDSEKCEMVTPILTYKDIETLRSLSADFGKRVQRAMRQGAAEYTFTLAQKVTHRRLCETSQTLWQAMKACLQAP